MAAFCVLALSLARLAWDFPVVIHQEMMTTRDETGKAVSQQSGIILTFIAGESFRLHRDVLQRVDSLKLPTLVSTANAAVDSLTDKKSGVVASVVGVADMRLDGIQHMAEQQLSTLNTTVSTALNGQDTGIVMPLRTLIRRYTDVPDEASGMAGPLISSLTHTAIHTENIVTDFPACDASPSCPANLILKLGQNADSITGSMAQIGKTMAQKPRWWERALGISPTAARIALAAHGQ